MHILNEKLYERWLSLTVTYSDKAVMDYAERWANLIEKSINERKTFEDVWRHCKAKARGANISALMERKAETYLFQVWKYGDKLREVLGYDEQRKIRVFTNSKR